MPPSSVAAMVDLRSQIYRIQPVDEYFNLGMQKVLYSTYAYSCVGMLTVRKKIDRHAKDRERTKNENDAGGMLTKVGYAMDP